MSEKKTSPKTDAMRAQREAQHTAAARGKKAAPDNAPTDDGPPPINPDLKPTKVGKRQAVKK